jgi:hypothetical protein
VVHVSPANRRLFVEAGSARDQIVGLSLVIGGGEMYGPYKSVEEACEAYAATLNRQVPQERFLQSLHPDVVFSTTLQHIEGEILVAFYLEERWHWSITDPWPVKNVTMPVRLRMAGGELKHYCGLFLVDRPDDIWEETHLRLKDGWVSSIRVIAPWPSSRYPFPERVRELAANLKSQLIR